MDSNQITVFNEGVSFKFYLRNLFSVLRNQIEATPPEGIRTPNVCFNVSSNPTSSFVGPAVFPLAEDGIKKYTKDDV